MKIFTESAFKTSPSAILLDLDDTLYSYEAAHEAAMQQVARLVQNRLGIDDKQFRTIFSEARKSVKQTLANAPAARSRLLYFQAMFEATGFGSSVIDALNCEQTYWNSLLQAAELFDGVRGFLDEARIKSIPLILITNLTSQIQFQSSSISVCRKLSNMSSPASRSASKNPMQKYSKRQSTCVRCRRRNMDDRRRSGL